MRSNEFGRETACQMVDFSHPPRTLQWINDPCHSTTSTFCATPTKKRDMTKSGVWDYMYSRPGSSYRGPGPPTAAPGAGL